MGYSDNILSPSSKGLYDFYSDGCGDTNDKKYYDNGVFIDFCGMSIKDYIENANECKCECECCSGSTGDDSSKKLNNILVKAFETNGVIYYQAFADYEVKSDIQITVQSMNNLEFILHLNNGSKQSEKVEGDTINLLKVNINSYEDDIYKYNVITEEMKNSYDIYVDMILYSKIGDFSDNVKKISIDDDSITNIKYVIPSTDINYNDMEDMNEFYKFCKNNQYCFTLCIPKRIYDDNSYKITNYGGIDVTNKFTLYRTITFSNIEYAYLNESATNDIMPYVPQYGEELVYEYKLELI